MNRAIFIPTALSLIAGVTDVTSWLLLGGFFSAHVTGNLVVVAADIVTGTPPDIVALLAIPVFILTTAIATVIARRIGARSPHGGSAPGPQRSRRSSSGRRPRSFWPPACCRSRPMLLPTPKKAWPS